ncbi:MAG: TolC family protein [Pseudobdellovibrionaceae bacterium]
MFKVFVVSLLLGGLFFQETSIASDGVLNVTPSVLREQIFHDGFDLKKSLLQVEQAKDSVNRAKADLLPSFSLGAVTGGPGGVAGQATSLLSFMMPSNWFRLSESSALYEAQKDGYQIAALNVMVDAYKLYFEILSNEELHKDFIEIYGKFLSLEQQSTEINNKLQVIDLVSSGLLQAQKESLQAKIVSLESLVEVEKLALAQMIASDKDLVINGVHLPPSTLENQTPDELLAALKNSKDPAPEIAQLDHFIKATKKAKWADVFAFINGKGAVMSTNADGNTGAVHFPVSGNVNLGFGIFPALSLNNHQIQLFQLQKDQLALQAHKLIKATLFSLHQSKTELESLTDADFQISQAFPLQIARLERNATDVGSLIGTLVLWQDIKWRKSKASTDIDHDRLKLQRLFRSGFFSKTTAIF